MEGLFSLRVKPRSPEAVERLHAKYRLFRNLLTLNNELLELLAELEEESSWSSFRHPRVRMGIRALFDGTEDMVQVLNQLAGNRYFDLKNVIAGVRADVLGFIERMPDGQGARLTLQFGEINSITADRVGGKALNLARLDCDLKMRVPAAFVVTTEAYRQFLEAEGLAGKLRTILAPARPDAPDDFKRRCEMAQGLVREATMPPAVEEAIRAAYRAAGFRPDEGVAVRSSAAGEDSELSFAGQFETFINVPESEVTGDLEAGHREPVLPSGGLLPAGGGARRGRYADGRARAADGPRQGLGCALHPSAGEPESARASRHGRPGARSRCVGRGSERR